MLGCAETKVATWDDLAFKLIILGCNVEAIYMVRIGDSAKSQGGKMVKAGTKQEHGNAKREGGFTSERRPVRSGVASRHNTTLPANGPWGRGQWVFMLLFLKAGEALGPRGVPISLVWGGLRDSASWVGPCGGVREAADGLAKGYKGGHVVGVDRSFTMDDNRTLAQLLEAPTVGYEDAIVVPTIITTGTLSFNARFAYPNSKQKFVGNKHKEDPHVTSLISTR
ncbi:hypothetical protein Tco_0357408 [Tanacetum coccineum]